MRRLPLVLALLVLVTIAHAGDDPPGLKNAPLMPSFVEADKGGIIVLRVGAIHSFKMQAGKRPTDIEVSREDILGVRLAPTDPDAASCLLIGKAVGSVTLTFTYTDKSKDTYTVFVEYERKPIAKLLRPGFVAVSVALPCENAVGGHLGLNDYVIVYSTKASGTEKKTTVLMKNVRVLSTPVGTKTHCSLLLEVTSEEAKLLRNATENGTIALGLVAESDVKDEKALQDRKGESESPRAAAPRTPDTR